MTGTEPWTCPTCHRTVSTPYCPGCGERPLRARELTLRGLFDQLVQAFTNIDGRLVRSFRYLLGRPGFLTVAYLRGQRKPYVGPVPLFLIANALFFAAESLTGGTVFTTPLESHLHRVHRRRSQSRCHRTTVSGCTSSNAVRTPLRRSGDSVPHLGADL